MGLEWEPPGPMGKWEVRILLGICAILVLAYVFFVK